MTSRLLPLRRQMARGRCLGSHFAEAMPRKYDWARKPAGKGYDALATGTVKWFNAEKGFGFIAPDEGGKDVFVHITAVREAGLEGLRDEQKVEFELQAGKDGRSSAGALQLL